MRSTPPDRIDLIGLDVGTTTVRGLRMSARRLVNATTGFSELADARVESRLSTQLTPFVEGDLDIPALLEMVEGWLEGSAPVAGGGVLLTGLAARSPSAGAAGEALRARVGDGVVLTASDPRLEAWVAFMARAGALSRANPGRWVVNLDIGGGTTNVAWGRNGTVLRTASLYVGARHVRLEPGSRRVAAMSPEASAMCEKSRFDIRPGLHIQGDLAETFIASMILGLREFVDTGEPGVSLERNPFLIQSPPRGAPIEDTSGSSPLITLSGGVGELVHGILAGEVCPGFDDLGPEMARALAASSWVGPLAAGSADAGLATVWGLTLHATAFSGATTYLGRPDRLPLRDLPIVARVAAGAGESAWSAALELARSTPAGAGMVIEELSDELEPVRDLGHRLFCALAGWPPEKLLVLIIRPNVGLALGQYATRWGAAPAPLVILDQMVPKEARLITLGRPMGGQVPVTFSGLCEGPGG